MYTDFYGLREKPFNIVPNPAYLYPSAKHKMALTYLEYGLNEGTGFILLTGEIGIGKTTLIRHLIAGLGPEVEPAVLFNTNVSAEDLLRLILQEFEAESAGSDKSANLEKINELLIEKYSQGKRPLLIVDEAQNLSTEALEEVRMLSNLHTESEALIRIALVGQPELRGRVRDPKLAQLAQRITVSYHLGPLNENEAREYVAHRLKSAGAERDDIFTPEAVTLIHQASKGIPRMINVLCDAALVYGFADETRSIGEEIVEQVIQDRDDVTQADEGLPQGSGMVGENGDGAQDGKLMERLRILENKVEKLSVLVDWQTNELNSKIDENRDRIVQKLEDLLQSERKRSDKLLLQCSAFQKKIRLLESDQVETETEATSDGDRSSISENEGADVRKSGLFGMFR